MADETTNSSEDTQLTFNVKAANDAKYVITLPESSTVADLKAKLSTSEYADLPPERQRLIYSGRVLKDHDTLASAKIKDGHTVHMVKGAASNARQNPAAASSSGGSSAPQVPTNIAAGTGNNPLAGLTGARYAGFHGLPSMDTFGADGGMGPPPDADRLLELMDNPMFLSQMNEAMNNPAIIEMMTQNPMFRNNPMMAEMIRNPEMRRMLFNPDMIRMQMQLQRSMGNRGSGSPFTAPGVTNTTPQTGSGSTATGNGQPNTAGAGQPPQDPLASLFGTGGGSAGANPFAALLGQNNPFMPQPPSQATNTSASNTGSNTNSDSNANPTPNTTSPPPPNQFGAFNLPATGDQQNNPIMDMTRQMMQNPEMMRQAMQMLNVGGGAGASPFGAPPTGTGSPPPHNPFASILSGGLGGFGTPPPLDNRPPEEVYATQLRQLNDMGFFEFDRNVQALRRSGGNVEGAIEFLLGGGS
ncbi:hypothetical protein GQ43DRAFT_456830 [Delitschia confertaspora ATCC 74209]|uniref:Ubiquitin family n=1 Tax=Delitschia confertaspora ATCC 74209 TaxID=1513339 RepID=A0A9P4MR06_9PLEO|nr:hypothetical protein GQ43DRAFT_456830 [Delitschia confertaspora ATCC 74209]